MLHESDLNRVGRLYQKTHVKWLSLHGSVIVSVAITPFTITLLFKFFIFHITDTHFTKSSESQQFLLAKQVSAFFDLGRILWLLINAEFAFVVLFGWGCVELFSDCKYIKSNEHFFFLLSFSLLCYARWFIGIHLTCFLFFVCMWSMFRVKVIYKWTLTRFTSQWFIQQDS